MKTIWIVKGKVTCQDCADQYGCDIGDVEYQFSDGPAGERGSSADYHNLEEGLAWHSPAIFYFEGDN
jgi:hypothetical protein